MVRTPFVLFVAGAQISPTGRFVAYGVQRDRRHCDRRTVLVDIRKEVFLGPQWSPDSRRLAFGPERDGKRQIYVIHPAGEEATQLTPEENGIGAFAWSPDGASVAYVSSGPESKARKQRKARFTR